MSSDPIALYGWTAVPLDASVLLNPNKQKLREPEPLSTHDILFPKTKLAENVQAYAQKHLSEETYNHSLRVYCFGQAIHRQYFPKWQLSDETYLITCHLHDIGTTESNISSTHLSFEFHGAMLAHTLLHDLGAPTAQVEAVIEAIIRHQDIGTKGTITTLGQLLQLATIFDNMGGHKELIHIETVKNVVEGWPRKGWSGCFAATIRKEVALKPWAHTTALGNEFPEGVEGNEVMKPFET